MRHLVGDSWSEAHEDAHLLEHTAPPHLAERLDHVLNLPPRLSHPRCITEESELLNYLEGLGLLVGEAFTVKQIDHYEGPITLAMNGRDISISYKAACKVFADPA